MVSRYEEYSTPKATSSGVSSGSSTQSSSSNSFTGITDPEALATLMSFIKQTFNGGSDKYKSDRADRKAVIADTKSLLGNYSRDAAFSDAKDLMAFNLMQSMEKNKPAITKSVEGAGTSASSMQGLLATKLANDSALAAGALGADQAKSYGGISASLSGVLEALTRMDPSQANDLLQALSLLKTSTSSSVSSGYSNQSANQSSGYGSGQNFGGGSSGSSFSPVQNSTYEPASYWSEDYYSTPASFANYSNGNSYTSNDIPSGGGFIAVNGDVTSTFNGGVNTPISSGSNSYYSNAEPYYPEVETYGYDSYAFDASDYY